MSWTSLGVALGAILAIGCEYGVEQEPGGDPPALPELLSPAGDTRDVCYGPECNPGDEIVLPDPCPNTNWSADVEPRDITLQFVHALQEARDVGDTTLFVQRLCLYNAARESYCGGAGTIAGLPSDPSACPFSIPSATEQLETILRDGPESMPAKSCAGQCPQLPQGGSCERSRYLGVCLPVS